MKKLLEELNQVPGVEGCMVITPDGMMVTEALGPNLDQDVVAALSSTFLIAMGRAVESVGESSAEEIVLSAEGGKLYFSDLGNAFLVVVTKPNLKLKGGLVEIRSFSRKIQEKCSLN